MHDIRINATPARLADIAARLPKNHQVELRLSVDDRQFQGLDLGSTLKHLMFATGTSDEELPTTIGARDVAHIKGATTIQTHLISAFFHTIGEPHPSQEQLDVGALTLDDMTTHAVKFLLSLHEQYMDPVKDAAEQEIVDLAQQQDLTLDDYYRETVQS